MMPLASSRPSTGQVYHGGPAFFAQPTLWGHNSPKWIQGWPLHTIPLYKYEDSKGAQPTTWEGFGPNHGATECQAFQDLPNGEFVVRRADQVPVSPGNSWLIGKPSQAVWQTKESQPAPQFGNKLEAFWQDWRAGRWYIPSRCGTDAAPSPWDESETLANLTALTALGKLMPQQPMPQFAATQEAQAFSPCPEIGCDPDGNKYCRPSFQPLPGAIPSEACRGLYALVPNAQDVVFDGASPSGYPANPCPGKTCTRRVYDKEGLGAIDYQFRPNGTVLHKWIPLRIPKKIDYLAPVITEPWNALVNNGYGRGKWVDDPNNPGQKIWVFEGLTPANPQPPTTPDSGFTTRAAQGQDQAPPEQQGFNLGQDEKCGPFSKAREDGTCGVNWPIVAGMAAALWFLTE